jgi:PKHD-type hydroxylase
MLLVIPNVLSQHQVAEFKRCLEEADWSDGKLTAGAQSGAVKNNRQLPENTVLSRELGDKVLDALAEAPLFVSAALPRRTFPPLFNRYDVGDGFGTHVDNAIRVVRGTSIRLRTDLSATLFISAPEDYDGGELIIETAFGAQSVKLPAGHLVLYPASSLHKVTLVTRGSRLASFFWVQSMVRDDADRAILFDLDQTIQELGARDGINDAQVLRLTGLYHNLLRRFAEV